MNTKLSLNLKNDITFTDNIQNRFKVTYFILFHILSKYCLKYQVVIDI